MTLRRFGDRNLSWREKSMANKKLAEKKSCYVLITCGNPNKEGKMNVEMSYDGDIDLAALLVDQAQTFFYEARDEAVPLEKLKTQTL